jgi:DNA-directed RNA polymerase subunit N (RpoN/RPB10)
VIFIESGTYDDHFGVRRCETCHMMIKSGYHRHARSVVIPDCESCNNKLSNILTQVGIRHYACVTPKCDMQYKTVLKVSPSGEFIRDRKTASDDAGAVND